VVTAGLPAWTVLAESGGVRLRAAGAGRPVVVFPGMEGSGESCLHLVEPVVLPAGAEPGGRVLLVDYAGERHRLLGELVDTVGTLLRAALPAGEPVTLWGQSFGNLLLALTVPALAPSQRRLVLVSPFTGLPASRVRAARASLAVAWPPLYRASSAPISRAVFGPAPAGTGEPFFRVLASAPPGVVRRRVGWLAGADHAAAFLALSDPMGVWLGERDRLVDLPRQLAFFTALARPPRHRLTVLGGSGHVVLPPPAVDQARDTITDWLLP
jgi:fermentation-respiration switch protein FrsA (DUF1100 family)